MPHLLANEQRVNPRIAVALELRLARKVGNAVMVHTCDLSVGGARVITSRPLRIYEELRFELDLPLDGPCLNGKARVMRQDRHDTYALRFERVTATTRRALDEFVAAGLPISG